jgi:hypothetical protein
MSSLPEYRKIVTTAAVAIQFDTNVSDRSTAQCNINPGFLVKTIIFKSITAFFDAPSTPPYDTPNSPLLIHCDLFGSKEAIGTAIHDNITYSYVKHVCDHQSLINVSNSFSFYITNLAGGDVNGAGTLRYSGRMVIFIELRSY